MSARASAIFVFSDSLLGSHVVHGSHDGACAGQIGLSGGVSLNPSQAHVEDLDSPLLIQQQVRRLDVAMDDSLGMCRFQACGRLQDAIEGLFQRERPIFLDQGRKIVSLDELHRQEMDAACLTGVEGGDDIGMRNSGSGLDLAFEAGDRRRILHEFGGEELDGHNAVHAPVPRFEDLPHAPRPDFFEQQVIIEDQ